jgi:hypothetical protein
MKLPDFGDVLETEKCHFLGIKSPLRNAGV